MNRAQAAEQWLGRGLAVHRWRAIMRDLTLWWQRREKLNANQELVGQGLANSVGSFFQSCTVSGSFSRSAVVARSGTQSGLFAVVSALGVLVTMLFLTPYCTTSHLRCWRPS